MPIPKEEKSVRWLQIIKPHYNVITIKTALFLSFGAPLKADILLHKYWQKRLDMCIAIKKAINNNNFLSLLPVLKNNYDDDNEWPSYWFISLFNDALKWQEETKNFIVNIDQTQLISIFAKNWSKNLLHTFWQEWIYYRKNCLEVKGINNELLITKYLLNIEKNSI